MLPFSAGSVRAFRLTEGGGWGVYAHSKLPALYAEGTIVLNSTLSPPVNMGIWFVPLGESVRLFNIGKTNAILPTYRIFLQATALI